MINLNYNKKGKKNNKLNKLKIKKINQNNKLQMIKNLKDFITKYYLIILGGLLFSIYFWNRFFRSRTSKMLPLELTVMQFFITLNVCIIFLYIVISLLYRRNQNSFIEQIINWLFIPIMEFDKYLKQLSFI